MKRIIIACGLLLLMTMPLMAGRVDVATAQKAAATFLNNNGAKSGVLTDLSKDAGFDNLYIFNGDQCYVVMAAYDCVKPILGYSLKSRFVAQGMPENLKGWLQGYNDQIQAAVNDKATATDDIVKEWRDLVSGKPGVGKSTMVVDALLQSKWNQSAPYNNLCPGGAVTGCVATAMAQIMNFWEYPAKGIGSHSYTHSTYGELSADFNATEYDWDNMTDTYGSSSTEAENLAVATLMYHCGVALEMDYGTSSSGAYSNRIAPSLINFFNYQSTAQYLERADANDDDAWKDMMRAELDAGRPMEYSGSGSGGHSFVCDGYADDDYFHFNFGWGGYCDDANYTIDNLYPGPGGIGSGGGTYNNNQAATIGIQPSTCTASAPTSLIYSQDNRDVTLQWTAGSNAASYNVYRDNVLLGNTTETEFATTAPFGTDNYYVRSLDSDGVLSLSSNSATVTIDYLTPVVDDLTVTYSEGNAELTWTAPDWCFPETASATMTYGTQTISGSFMNWGSNLVYWGHRYLASDLTDYDGMYLYNVSFQAHNAGTYGVTIYTGTNSGTYVVPVTQVATQSMTVTAEGWYDFDFETPIAIDASQDLWVFINNPEVISGLRSYICTNSDGLGYGCYYSSNPQNYTYNNITAYAFLIKTSVTDGTYSYNLYDNGTSATTNIAATSQSVSSPATNTAHQYTVKTNYYGGETNDSNIAGLTLGETSVATLELEANDIMTLTEGSTLTVTGTLTNTDAAQLIIEDGAQLIHPNSAATATLKKSINAYSTESGVNNGWYTIASPVDALGIDIAATGTYDLYTYDEPSVYWLNQENTANSITQFDEGLGYLYANASAQNLAFAGSTKATSTTITKTLSCASDNANLKGFNLMGNPFTRNLNYGDLSIGGTTLTTYYVVEGGAELVSRQISDYPIKPGQGFFVQATTASQELVFNPSSKDGQNTKPAYISIEAGNTDFTDYAYVQIGQGNTLHKMTLGNNTARLSIHADDADFAAFTIQSVEGQLPLNFKAVNDGTYTLTIEVKNLDLSYLHLIDNLTGADVDLLLTPSYTFDAKTSDYTSRFKLLFNEIDPNSTGDLNPEGAALRILDLTGRVVATDRNTQLAPGVYILQTSNGNKKIIIDK